MEDSAQVGKVRNAVLEPLRKILIIKMSSIGDVVHSLPVLTALRRKFPQVAVSWLVEEAAAGIVSGHPHLDETIVLGNGEEKSEPGVAYFPSARSLIRGLRRRRFDVSLDLQGLLRTALYALLGGVRWRVGYRNYQEGAFLFNNLRVVPDRQDHHAVTGYLGFAHWLEAETEPLDFTILFAQADQDYVDGFVKEQGVGEGDRLIALVPGAGWESKRWPEEHFAALADGLADLGRIVLVGSPSERPMAQRIQDLASVPLIDATGRTSLKQLAALLRCCQLTVANDSGPMHISAAVGTPVVGIFGPTDPHRTGPYGPGHTVLTADLPCLNCRRRQCSHLSCMHQVTPEQVLEVARRKLEAED